MASGLLRALVRSNPVGMKLGDELSGELNFRNSDYDPKDVANRNRKSQTQKRFELIAKWLTVLAR